MPTSSRNRVPPWAISKSPGLDAIGPSERAFLVSKQFAFQQVGGMAAQFISTKGCAARGLS